MTDLFAYPHQPGARDRDTSRAAASHIAPAAASLRDQVLGVFERSNGLTPDEAAGKLGLTSFTVRPRCTELLRLGQLRDSGERRKNRSGRSAAVLVAVYPARLQGQRRA